MQSSRLNFPDPMAGALCYVMGPVSGALFLFWKRYRRNAFVRFHAWQSIFFSIGGLLALSLFALGAVLLPLEYVGWAMFGIVACNLVLVLLWFRAILKALNGIEWHMPLAGPMARACL
jgi:uncharacterized membrane protein